MTQVLQMGMAAHGRGNLAEAERLYRQVLAASPKDSDAHHLLGVLLHQSRRSAAGIEMVQRAITLNPNAAIYYGNLANMYRETGHFAQAAKAFEDAIRLDPGNTSFRFRLAGLLSNDLHKPGEAAPLFKDLLQSQPQSEELLFQLALALHRTGNIREALPYYEQAVALAPRDTDLLSNYANALLTEGNREQALAVFHRAIAIDPKKAILHYNLGVALMSDPASEDAANAFRKTIELNPDDMFGYINLAAVLRYQGKLEESAQIYAQLLERYPQEAHVHSNLGLTRLNQGRQDEAIEAMRKAVLINPHVPMLYSNLLLSLHYHPDYDSQKLFAEHRVWGEMIEARVTPMVHTPRSSASRRLRIGYVSPDFRQHSVAFFIEPILDHHHRRAFEIFCYANQPISDSITHRLRSLSDNWRNILSLPDPVAAEIIRKDEIDILIDLAVHTNANRLELFAHKPAPIQGTYLGYASTTGLRAIDFRLTDAWVDPPGTTDAHHTEKLIRLPDTQWVYRPMPGLPDVSPLPAEQRGHITFGAATNLAKINPDSIAMWSRVLMALPSAILIIKGNGTDNPPTQNYFRQAFLRAGVAEKQIQFQANSPIREYFDFFSSIDLILDTYPYAGGTTSCHALYMGAPMVTRTGNSSVSRVGASLLHNVGLAELMSDSAEGFVETCLRIASDIPRLSQMRRHLREKMRGSPLMDELRFVRNLEAAYQAIRKN